MKVRIEIDTKTFVRFWLVVIGFVFAIYLMYLSRTALVIVFSAAFLALALSSPVNHLVRYIPGRSRVGATALAFVSLVLFLAMMIFLVIPPIIDQTIHFIDTLPALIDSVSAQWSGFGSFVDKYQLQPQIDTATASFNANIDGFIADAGQQVVSSVGSLFAAIGAIILTLVLSFLMLVEGPVWINRLWSVYHDKENRDAHKRLARRMNEVVSGYVTGQITVSGIGAIFAGLTVFIISLFVEAVPANLAMPTVAIAFTLSLIPMFGATIAGILVSLLLAINNVPAAVVFAIYFIVYQQIENNFISPAIQSKYVKLSPLAVLVAVTIGLYLFGLAGGIISIPIAGCIKVLVEEYFGQRSKKKPVRKPSPLAKLAKS